MKKDFRRNKVKPCRRELFNFRVASDNVMTPKGNWRHSALLTFEPLSMQLPISSECLRLLQNLNPVYAMYRGQPTLLSATDLSSFFIVLWTQPVHYSLLHEEYTSLLSLYPHPSKHFSYIHHGWDRAPLLGGSPIYPFGFHQFSSLLACFHTYDVNLSRIIFCLSNSEMFHRCQFCASRIEASLG